MSKDLNILPEKQKHACLSQGMRMRVLTRTANSTVPDNEVLRMAVAYGFGVWQGLDTPTRKSQQMEKPRIAQAPGHVM